MQGEPYIRQSRRTRWRSCVRSQDVPSLVREQRTEYVADLTTQRVMKAGA
jgi:hypothetical protein